MAEKRKREFSEFPSLGEAGLELPRVSRIKYAAHFLLFFVLLMLLSLRMEKKTDYGLTRIERNYLGGSPLFTHLDPQSSSSALARELDLSAEDIETGQFVAEAYLNNLQAKRPKTPSRLITIYDGEYYYYYVGYEILIEALFAWFFSMYFYLRERLTDAGQLIVNQHARFQNLNEQLERRIEESTRIIEKMNKLQSKLVQAEKLASVGRLSATLAHEIRNPLSIIKSTTEIVMDDLPRESGGASAIGMIREEIDRMDRIISDLLNFARPKEPNLSRHALKTLVRHWLPPVVEELEKGKIQLVPQLEDFDAEVLVDPDQLYQVFLNIMWNARDALSGLPNPHIFVRTEEGDGRYARLIIRDTGPGMIPELLGQIGEPFFTTKTKGSGLGLPVSIQLIEGMRGRLEIDSELEVGTTVLLLVPLADAPFRDPNASDQSFAMLAAESHTPPGARPPQTEGDAPP